VILTVALGVTLGGAGSFYSAATKRNAVAAQGTNAYDRGGQGLAALTSSLALDLPDPILRVNT
jgi:hypothetical protein